MRISSDSVSLSSFSVSPVIAAQLDSSILGPSSSVSRLGGNTSATILGGGLGLGFTFFYSTIDKIFCVVARGMLGEVVLSMSSGKSFMISSSHTDSDTDEDGLKIEESNNQTTSGEFENEDSDAESEDIHLSLMDCKRLYT